MRNFIVYKHTSPSGKVYIGQTSVKPEYRWNHGNGYKEHPYFYNAIQKYGWNNFKHEIIVSNLTEDEASQIEELLIALYDSTNSDKGYNLQFGGECGAFGVKWSKESRKKLSESCMGRKPWNKGKQHTKETRVKMRELSPRKRSVVCIETGEIFSSITEAAKVIGVTRGAVGMVCQGRRKTAGGYHWKYI